MELEQTSTIPEVGKTIVLLRQLSADEKVQQEAWYREKQLHDEASALGFARRKGVIETLSDLVNQGLLTVAQAAAQAKMTPLEFEETAKEFSRED